MVNDVLYHLFQPRAKPKVIRNDLVLQLAEKMRTDILVAYNDNNSHLDLQRLIKV